MIQSQEEQALSQIKDSRVTFITPEWASHAATWLQWPHSYQEAKYAATFSRIVKELYPYERVHLMVPNEEVRRSAQASLGRAGVPIERITFHEIPTDSCWCRDSGPIFVATSNGLCISDWRFTGWGRTKKHKNDDRIPGRVARILGLRRVRQRMVLEGGVVEFNGAGAAITSWPCLHHRNTSMSRKRMERTLKEAFNLSQVVWLEKAPPRDEDYTRGHVDGIARFIKKKTVVVGKINEPHDPVAKVFESAAQIIKNAGFKVERLPVPVKRMRNGSFDRYNYLNWYVANGIVLVGVFGSPAHDRAALARIRRYWPKRKVVGINIREMWQQGGGGIHCVTQQQPLFRCRRKG
jgi:agmatine deiminase